MSDAEVEVVPEPLPIPPEPLVDATAASRYLGFSPVSIRRMARAGRIPAISITAGANNVWRFRLSDLVKFVNDNQRAAVRKHKEQE